MALERFEMKIAPEMLARVDRWRGQQPVPPSRAEAIRRLIEQALSGIFRDCEITK